MINDTEHWHNLKPPLAPNEYEIEIYKKLIGTSKPVYLLGMTKQLVPLCDVAIDLNPIEINKPTLKMDWKDITNFYAGAIIGDGPINFMGLDFVKTALSVTDKLICRVFLKKLPGMKYATIFPTEFPGSDKIIYTQDGTAIVLWLNS